MSGIYGDPHRLRQILVNLLGNSLKFTKAGGAIVLQARAKYSEAGYVMLEFTVTDTGIGIPEDRQKDIFKPFEQMDSEPCQHFATGTGLGLAICARIVALMNGTISVSSRPRRGSAFIFSVQLALQSQISPISPALQADPVKIGRALRVLLVEDNPINIKVAERALTKDGHTVVVANNGLEAVDAASKQDFDLILMDCSMPIMDGYEATRRIREGEVENGRRVPIIAMSAFAGTGNRLRCLEVGMDDYIEKPCRLRELRTKIEALNC